MLEASRSSHPLTKVVRHKNGTSIEDIEGQIFWIPPGQTIVESHDDAPCVSIEKLLDLIKITSLGCFVVLFFFFLLVTNPKSFNLEGRYGWHFIVAFIAVLAPFCLILLYKSVNYWKEVMRLVKCTKFVDHSLLFSATKYQRAESMILKPMIKKGSFSFGRGVHFESHKRGITVEDENGEILYFPSGPYIQMKNHKDMIEVMIRKVLYLFFCLLSVFIGSALYLLKDLYLGVGILLFAGLAMLILLVSLVNEIKGLIFVNPDHWFQQQTSIN